MCEKCEKLVKCCSDRKATTVLEEAAAYDAKYIRSIMQLNHDEEKKEPYAFIAFETTIDSTGRVYGSNIDIRYCPFCGEKLY